MPPIRKWGANLLLPRDALHTVHSWQANGNQPHPTSCLCNANRYGQDPHTFMAAPIERCAGCARDSTHPPQQPSITGKCPTYSTGRYIHIHLATRAMNAQADWRSFAQARWMHPVDWCNE